MGLDTADFIVITVLVGMGCAVCSAGLWVIVRQAGAARQRAVDDRLAELTGSLKALEAKIAELGKIDLQRTDHRAHRASLRRTADT